MREFLVLILVRSLPLSALGLLFLLTLRKAPAATRHAVAVSTLLALLALPLLCLTMPRRNWAVFPAEKPIAFTEAPAPIRSLSVSNAAPAAPDPKPVLNVDWLLVLYALGAGIGAARYALGLATVWRWRQGGVARDLGIGSARMVVSGHANGPMAVWLGRNLLFLPDEWESWGCERRRSVLAHELAHISRRDPIWRLASRIARCLFWPNPMVWLLCLFEADLAELSADDRVLLSGVAPSRYAHDLLEIARETKATAPVPAVAIGRRPEVARRIEMILNSKVNRGALTRAGAVTCGIVALLLVLPVASLSLVRKQQAGHAETTGAPRIPIKIETYFLKPGSGVPSVIEPKKKKGEDGNYGPFSTTDEKVTRKLIDGWKQRGSLEATPRVFTFSGYEATLESHSVKSDLKASITPTITSEGRIELKIKVDKRSGDKSSVQQVDTVVAEGVAISLFETRKDGDKGDLICLLIPSIVRDR